MIRGFYTGSRGVLEFQKAMDVTANNLSNSNTDGYKSARLTFKEILYKRVRMPDDYEDNREVYDRNIARNRALREYTPTIDEETEGDPGTSEYFSENKLRIGGGTKAAGSALNMSPGAFYETGDMLNAVIVGNGFFCVEGMDGESYYYTRDGAFRISTETDDNYLVTALGEYVLDGSYNRIVVPQDVEMPTITLDDVNSGGGQIGEDSVPVGVFLCSNVYGLHLTGGNKFTTTDYSGEMEAIGGDIVGVKSGYLEMSNVSLAEEMARVIQFQRAFQSNLTLIRTADEIEAYTNQMR